MRIVSRSTLRTFWELAAYADSEGPLLFWYEATKDAEWQSFADVKNTFAASSFVGNNRIVFNIGGNKYRLVAKIDFKFSLLFVRFIGTHQQYDQIDAGSV